MTKVAIVSADTAAIAHTGRGRVLPAGRYEAHDIDGAAERGVVYLTGPDGDLVCISAQDPNVTYSETGG